MIKSKKKAIAVFITILFIIIICFTLLLFLSVPNGDAIKNAMEKDDFVTLTDISETTPILGHLLPEGANRSLTFTKNVNLDLDTVTIIYFDNYKALNNYKDSIDSNENQVELTRGKALFIGPKKTTTSIRWKLWAFGA